MFPVQYRAMRSTALPSLLPLAGAQLLLSILSVVLGLILLMGAADRFVESAVRLARTLGVSIVLIGALIVGLGTSLPELLVSAIASIDGNIDIAMANVTGSNVANVTLVLGAAAVAGPGTLTDLARPALIVMVVVIAAAGSFAWNDRKIVRREGLILLGIFVVFAVLSY